MLAKPVVAVSSPLFRVQWGRIATSFSSGHSTLSHELRAASSSFADIRTLLAAQWLP